MYMYVLTFYVGKYRMFFLNEGGARGDVLETSHLCNYFRKHVKSVLFWTTVENTKSFFSLEMVSGWFNIYII